MFKKLFGSERREIWNQVARELDAEVFEGGAFSNEHTLTLHVHDWQIVLDYHVVSSGNSSSEYTRMRAPFMNPKNLHFKLSKSNFMVDAANRLFRLQDIEVGYPYFDKRFIIKGNNEAAVKALFQNMNIRSSLMDIKAGGFRVLDKVAAFSSLPQGVNVLEQQIYGVIKDPTMLKEMFSLFRTTLVELYEYNHQVVLEPGARPMLDAIKERLETNLSWCTPIVERRGQGLEAPISCRLDHDYRGRASVSAPLLPECEVDISIEVDIPPLPHTLTMRPLETMTDRALNLTDDNIGDVELDKALIIKGDARGFVELADDLKKLIARGHQFRVHFEDNRLHVLVKGVVRDDIETQLSDLHAFWKRSLICAARITQKALPVSNV